MSLSGITALERYAQRFSPTIPKTPSGRFASTILLRETKSYAIFTTEGGEQQDVELTQAGLTSAGRIDRLVLFKRKQVAPERRTGKALLRQYGCFPFAIVSRDGEKTEVIYGTEAIAKAQEEVKGKRNLKITDPITDCYLIAGMCSHCVDCLTYGFAAVEGEGARKARVMTDSCFSVRPYPLIQKKVKFNVIDEQEQSSGTITEFDYTMPEVFLPAIVTTVDLTMDEFIYVLDNVIRTTRYGKESSRQGFIRNHILAIAFSDMELFSNLEFSQAFYDAFTGDTSIQIENGLSLQDFQRHAPRVIQDLTANLNGRLSILSGEELRTVLSQLQALNQDEHRLATFLKELNRQAASFAA
ncbi:MAG TPA: type I-D CRISPR-associated protein Cas7/Csc2 [Alphaproteobacteria bacterium]|nr:type I-D CRISPR-associated protein Cas7/Csc2 [Alphaproteobacteria bacterium]